MDTIVKKAEAFEISPEEREWIEQHRAAATDHKPIKLADITAAKLNALSKADQQRILDRVMAGEVE